MSISDRIQRVINTFSTAAGLLKQNKYQFEAKNDLAINDVLHLQVSLIELVKSLEVLLEEKDSIDGHPVFQIVNERVRVCPGSYYVLEDEESYCQWLKERTVVVINYLQFKIWQQTSLAALLSMKLDAVASEIVSDSIEEKAGVQLFRDIKVLVPSIARELQAYANSDKNR